MSQTPKFINPAELPKPNGYSHVVETRGSRTVYFSGQVGINADGEMAADFEAQCRQTFKNLQIALNAVNLEFSSVVKLGMFVTDMSHLATLRRVRDEFVNLEASPASTTVQVTAFFRPDVLFEADAIAVGEDG